MTRRGRIRPALLAVLAAAMLAVAGATTAVPARAAGACAAEGHPGGDWPVYGHDLSNTRHQPAETVITPGKAATLEPVWDTSASEAGGRGDFTGTPVVAFGCLYAGSNAGWVFALNADTGAPVWARKLPNGGGVNSSVAVTADRVYAAVARGGSPYLAALDRSTGTIAWERQLDSQPGSEVYASPVVYGGVVFIGVSGGSAELGDEADRYAFQGSFVLVDAVTGETVKKTWTIREPDPDPSNPKDDFAGATVWSTPAIDTDTGFAYVGAGNPFRPQAEHAHANSILKIDLRRTFGEESNPDFGKVVGHYKGQVDEYVPLFSELPCHDIPGNPPPYYPQGIGQCGDVDLDFGASPNLFRDSSGRKLVGAGQKSGVYHVADPASMKPVWSSLVGPPSSVGGIVGSTAFDGRSIHGPIVPAGYLWSVRSDTGALRWASPVGDGAHWGNPVASANGVVYTVDLKGFLDAYDADTGLPLLHRPLVAGTGGSDPMLSWGGVSVARNTVYASVGITGLPNGHVIAFRPSSTLPSVEPPDPPPGFPPEPPGDAGPVVASGPFAQSYGYVTPAVATRAGGPLTYANVDLVRHDVVQDVNVDGFAGAGDQPWCGRFPAGKCPLFWTPLIGLGERTAVRGLERLERGKVYSFYCTAHPGMKGKLAVAP